MYKTESIDKSFISFVNPEEIEHAEPKFYKKFNDYWLNPDGSIEAKSSWFSRLIRWIQNYFFDKTIEDIWSVFKKAAEDLQRTRQYAQFEVEYDEIRNKTNRLLFAAKFLHSRKKNFDKWIAKHEKEGSEFLAIIKMCKETSKSQPKAKSVIKRALHCIKKISLPDLKPEVIKLKPAELEFQVTPEKDSSLYESIDIKILVEKFDSFFTRKEDYQTLYLSFASQLKSGDFDKCLIATLKKDLIKKRLIKKEYNIDDLEIKGIKDLSFFNEIKCEGLAEFLNQYCLYAAGQIDRAVVELEENVDKKALLKEIVSSAIDSTLKEFKCDLLREFALRRENFVKLINRVLERDNSIIFGLNENNRDHLYDQIELYLKNILYIIEKNEGITGEQKRRALTELSYAAGECPARWVEDSKIQYQELASLSFSNVREQILNYLQSIKEEIILLLTNEEDIHFNILNTYRELFEVEFGLKQHLQNEDIFKPEINEKQLKVHKDFFLKKFNTKAVINGIKNRINLDLMLKHKNLRSSESLSFLDEATDNSSIFKYIENCLEQYSIQDPSEFIEKNFKKEIPFNQDETLSVINSRGVEFILETLGMLRTF